MAGTEAPGRAEHGWRTASAGPRWGMWILGAIFRFFPLAFARILTWPLLWGWLNHWNRPRVAVMAVGRRLGDPSPFLFALRTYAAFAAALVERAYTFSGRTTPIWVLGPGAQASMLLERAIADPSPLVFLGSHLGTLEMAVSAIETRGRLVRAVAVRDAGAQGLLGGVGDASEHVGGARSTIVADGSATAGLAMLRALRGGDVLTLKVDRVLADTPPQHVRTLRFLGADAEFPIGPFELVRAARARAIALSVVRRGPAIYELLAEELPTDGQDAAEIQRAWLASFERHLRAAPTQFFNFFPYWLEDRPLADAEPRTVPRPLRATFGFLPAMLWICASPLGGRGSPGLALLATAGAALLSGISGATLSLDGRANGRAHLFVPLGAGLAALVAGASSVTAAGAAGIAALPAVLRLVVPIRGGGGGPASQGS